MQQPLQGADAADGGGVAADTAATARFLGTFCFGPRKRAACWALGDFHRVNPFLLPPMQVPADHKVTPTGIEYVEVAGDKAAMADWIGSGSEFLPLKCALPFQARTSLCWLGYAAYPVL